ncbi:bromodomain-containing protein 1 isoform X2 [Folsomia candida]|uniref:bromodomain-containing protein 1 isoform X2 n=1 Tax=Folsomia candida TaxID=158441 RepID=UPI000B904951|nr:bromodomain-containing protein 1 isoform X2 [Folsomia candida]
MSPVHEPALKQLGGSPIRRKRKLVSSGGQKWFKGSPRKKERPSSTPGGGHQLKQNVGGGGNNSLELMSPTNANPTLPPMLVQFILHGGAELRLSVYDQIPVTSKPDEDVDLSSKKKKKCKEEGQDQQISDLPAIVQQSDEHRSLPQPNYHLLEEYTLNEAPPLPNAYIRWMDDVELGEEVEYHVDEEDSAWLDLINSGRDGVGITLEVMELLMDRLEKESYLQMQSSGLDQRPVIDDDAVCCICMDGECQNSNAILFCDMCNLAVHQECYGVPYIPEGQWLCRRCLQSPSREVECVLCPNKGGAFKQTDDGRWAHVVCAIWIPEVCFANTVFLEPVDSVNNIPPARWRLCCFICKYKGRGACIQCHKSNCYIAFHVTCAQHAGLCMRMDTVRIGSTVTVRKTAYCDNHAPPDFIRTREGDSSPTVRQKLKACRKMLAEKRSAKPTLSIPTIPPERVTEISSSVSFARKNVFIKRLLSYWKLKRIQRNGVPLLRRLQAASNHPPSSGHHRAQLIHDPSIGAPSQSDHAWKFLMRLRQDLERARLLCELIRKREKQKRELVALRTEEWSFKTVPFVQLLLSVLNEIGGRDPQNIFAEPVDAEAVPDYHTVIHSPMDLSTMRQRAQQLHYDSLNEMKKDFQLMINNCLLYNSKETIFHRTGLRLQESGSMIFREAEKVQDQIGYDPDSGLHLDKAPTLSISSNSATPASTTRRSDDHIFEEMDAFLKDEDRLQLPHDVHVAKLQDIADKVVTVQHTGARKKRYERLYREIQRVRRLENPSPKSPRSPKRELHPSSPISRQSVSPTPTLRKLRRKSVIDQTDEHENKDDDGDEAIKERPPKRRVVQQMEAKSTASVTQTRRMSRTLDSSPATHPAVVAATPTRNHHAPCAAPATPVPATPLRRTTRLSVDGEQQQRVTRTQLGTPTSTTNTTPTKASPLVNGIMRNGTRNNTHNNNNNNKKIKSAKKSREVDAHPVLAAALMQQQPRLPVPVDSFSVYREEKRDSSDGEEQDEKEDEQEDEDDQTDDDSSSEGDDSSSEDEVSDESSDAAATNHHHMHRVLTRGGGKTNSTDVSSNRASRTSRRRRRRDSSSSSSSASSSHSSRSSSSDGQVTEETQKVPLLIPEHMQLVWAYAHEAWSPALIVNPENVGLSPSPDKNGVTIPVPPVDVLNRRPPAGRKRAGKEFHLVLFFDKSSTWEWVTRRELEPLGVTPALDRRHLLESQNPKKQRRAFDKAILHKASVKTGQASNTIQPPPLDLD